jgi:hypothetical protein
LFADSLDPDKINVVAAHGRPLRGCQLREAGEYASHDATRGIRCVDPHSSGSFQESAKASAATFTWNARPPRADTNERKHIMNTTHNPESTHGLGSLKKLVTGAFLAGGVGLAVIGLGAGTANATPLPAPVPVLPRPGGPAPTNPPPSVISNAPGLGSGNPLQPLGNPELTIAGPGRVIFDRPFMATVGGVPSGGAVRVYEDNAHGAFLGETSGGPIQLTWSVFTGYGHHALYAQEIVGSQYGPSVTTPLFIDGAPDG